MREKAGFTPFYPKSPELLRRDRTGFTLIEVLLAIIILGSTITFIFQAYFTSLDAIETCRNRLLVINKANDLINDIKMEISNGARLIPFDKDGVFPLDEKECSYTISTVRVEPVNWLADMNLTFCYNEGRRKITIKRREIYPCFPPPEENKI